MPTPPTSPAASPTTHRPAFAGGAPSLASTPITLPRDRGPWTYMASPSVLTCVEGHIVPVLKRAYHKQGVNGNGRDPGRGEGCIMEMQQRGFVAIPHDIPTTVFGVARPPCEHSTYLTRTLGAAPATGPAPEYWSDAWTRIRQVGHMVVRDRDEAGRLEFLLAVRQLACPGEFEAWQVEQATKPRLRKIAHLRRSASREPGRSAELIEAEYHHLPAAFRPAPEPEPEIQAKPATKRSAKSA